MHASRIPPRPHCLVGASLAALVATTTVAIACPAAPPGVATGEVYCDAAGSIIPPWDGLGDHLRIANSPGAFGALTLSAGETITLSAGTDPDPADAGPHTAVGRNLGSVGTLTIDGAGAALVFNPEGRGSSLHLGRDGGNGTAVVSNGGAMRMLSSTDAGFSPDLISANISVGRAGVGTIGRLTVNAGTIDLNTPDTTLLRVGVDGATGYMTVENGSTVSLATDKVGAHAHVNIGGGYESTGVGQLMVDASDVSLSSGDGFAGFYVGRGIGSIGSASFDNGATLSLNSNTSAGITLGDGPGAFGALAFEGGSTVAMHSADSYVDIGRIAGSVGIMTITEGSKVTMTADDPEEADVYVGAAFSDIGGRSTAGDGTLLVSGPGSELSLTSSVVVGAFGGVSKGRMTVENGGTVSAKTVYVGLGGRLDGDGGFVLADIVVDGGVLAPGASPGTLSIAGDLTLIDGGVLELEIDGNGAGEHDVLNIAGAVDLSGGITSFVFDPTFFAQVEADFALMPLLTSFFPGQDPTTLATFSYGGVAAGRSPFALSFGTGGALTGLSFAAPVPLPAALPFMLLALAALATLRRRRQPG